MKRVLIREYERRYRSEIGSAALRELQLLDARLAAGGTSSVFDWSHPHYIAAKNWVGVVQVRGLTIEILPKVDAPAACTPEESDGTAQGNLLYMLVTAGYVPARDRGVADLSTERLPLLEALILLFAQRLLEQLQRGIRCEYTVREENFPFYRGRLLIREHIKRNLVHRERAFLGLQEYVVDTPLNRLLRATCRRLLPRSHAPACQQALRIALLYMQDVEDVEVTPSFLSSVFVDRQSERYRDLVDFCRLVWSDRLCGPRSGGQSAFSLLFPMDVLFQEFIAGYMVRNSSALGLRRDYIHTQGTRNGRWLARTEDMTGRFRLKPDITIGHPGNAPLCVLDTKWKRLSLEQANQGVSQSDIYQLYAYANQYECDHNVLLYPLVAGCIPQTLSIEGKPERRLRIEFVDISRSLVKEPASLKNGLLRALN